MRKQTKLWKTKDGQKIRICDMDDKHLRNTTKMLVRFAEDARWKMIRTLSGLELIVSGEHAQDMLDDDLREAEEATVLDWCPFLEYFRAECQRRWGWDEADEILRATERKQCPTI